MANLFFLRHTCQTWFFSIFGLYIMRENSWTIPNAFVTYFFSTLKIKKYEILWLYGFLAAQFNYLFKHTIGTWTHCRRNPEIQTSPVNVMIFGHFRHQDIELLVDVIQKFKIHLWMWWFLVIFAIKNIQGWILFWFNKAHHIIRYWLWYIIYRNLYIFRLSIDIFSFFWESIPIVQSFINLGTAM